MRWDLPRVSSSIPNYRKLRNSGCYKSPPLRLNFVLEVARSTSSSTPFIQYTITYHPLPKRIFHSPTHHLFAIWESLSCQSFRYCIFSLTSSRTTKEQRSNRIHDRIARINNTARIDNTIVLQLTSHDNTETSHEMGYETVTHPSSPRKHHA